MFLYFYCSGDHRDLNVLTHSFPTRRSSDLACEAAAKACVLLQNDGVLPLTREGRTIALVGPLADSRANLQGTWAVSARPEDSVTVLEGLRAPAGDHSPVLHAQGANNSAEPHTAASPHVSRIRHGVGKSC